VRAPHQDAGGGSETWQQVEALLAARRDWDRRHGLRPPSGVVDVEASVAALASGSAV